MFLLKRILKNPEYRNNREVLTTGKMEPRSIGWNVQEAGKAGTTRVDRYAEIFWGNVAHCVHM
jgi:hypothetical protein